MKLSIYKNASDYKFHKLKTISYARESEMPQISHNIKQMQKETNNYFINQLTRKPEQNGSEKDLKFKVCEGDFVEPYSVPFSACKNYTQIYDKTRDLINFKISEWEKKTAEELDDIKPKYSIRDQSFRPLVNYSAEEKSASGDRVVRGVKVRKTHKIQRIHTNWGEVVKAKVPVYRNFGVNLGVDTSRRKRKLEFAKFQKTTSFDDPTYVPSLKINDAEYDFVSNCSEAKRHKRLPNNENGEMDVHQMHFQENDHSLPIKTPNPDRKIRARRSFPNRVFIKASSSESGSTAKEDHRSNEKQRQNSPSTLSTPSMDFQENYRPCIIEKPNPDPGISAPRISPNRLFTEASTSESENGTKEDHPSNEKQSPNTISTPPMDLEENDRPLLIKEPHRDVKTSTHRVLPNRVFTESSTAESENSLKQDLRSNENQNSPSTLSIPPLFPNPPAPLVPLISKDAPLIGPLTEYDEMCSRIYRNPNWSSKPELLQWAENELWPKGRGRFCNIYKVVVCDARTGAKRRITIRRPAGASSSSDYAESVSEFGGELPEIKREVDITEPVVKVLKEDRPRAFGRPVALLAPLIGPLTEYDTMCSRFFNNKDWWSDPELLHWAQDNFLPKGGKRRYKYKARIQHPQTGETMRIRIPSLPDSVTNSQSVTLDNKSPEIKTGVEVTKPVVKVVKEDLPKDFAPPVPLLASPIGPLTEYDAMCSRFFNKDWWSDRELLHWAQDNLVPKGGKQRSNYYARIRHPQTGETRNIRIPCFPVSVTNSQSVTLDSKSQEINKGVEVTEPVVKGLKNDRPAAFGRPVSLLAPLIGPLTEYDTMCSRFFNNPDWWSDSELLHWAQDNLLPKGGKRRNNYKARIQHPQTGETMRIRIPRVIDSQSVKSDRKSPEIKKGVESTESLVKLQKESPPEEEKELFNGLDKELLKSNASVVKENSDAEVEETKNVNPKISESDKVPGVSTKPADETKMEQSEKNNNDLKEKAKRNRSVEEKRKDEKQKPVEELPKSNKEESANGNGQEKETKRKWLRIRPPPKAEKPSSVPKPLQQPLTRKTRIEKGQQPSRKRSYTSAKETNGTYIHEDYLKDSEKLLRHFSKNDEEVKLKKLVVLLTPLDSVFGGKKSKNKLEVNPSEEIQQARKKRKVQVVKKTVQSKKKTEPKILKKKDTKEQKNEIARSIRSPVQGKSETVTAHRDDPVEENVIKNKEEEMENSLQVNKEIEYSLEVRKENEYSAGVRKEVDSLVELIEKAEMEESESSLEIRNELYTSIEDVNEADFESSIEELIKAPDDVLFQSFDSFVNSWQS